MNLRTGFYQSLLQAPTDGIRVNISWPRLVAALAASEGVLIAMGGHLSRRLTLSATGQTVAWDVVTGVAVLSGVFYVAVARSFGLYGLAALMRPDLKRVAATCGIVLLVLTANLFAFKAAATVSPWFMAAHGLVMLGATCFARLGMHALLPRMMADDAVSGRAAVLIGVAHELEAISARELFQQFGITEVARVEFASGREIEAANWRDAIDEAVRVARALRAKEFVVALPWADVGRLREVEHRLRLCPLPVRLLPDSSVRKLLRREGCWAPAPLQLIDLQRAPLTAYEQASKRCFDIAVALTTLVVLAPLLAAVALLIKFDTRGPVLFHQRRNGFNQNEFVIHKFRTMRVLEDSPCLQQARRNDDRITRVGRFLRRTSIDELPQLLNVLKGEMSIVGPRPHALAHDAQYSGIIGDYCLRHHVKPGITGWAQINGLRGETEATELMSRRVEFDIWYVSHWSLALDCWIILRTALEVLSHDAY